MTQEEIEPNLVERCNLDDLKSKMLEYLSNSDAFFRSQQQGEADLAQSEKYQIAEEILNRNPSLFLQRFHKNLRLVDIPFFESRLDDYQVNFYLSEIQKINDLKSKSILVKNRRYDCLQKLIGSCKYFTDCAMRARNPFLYHQMIGQYLTDGEREDLEEKPDSATFSGFLMRSIQKSQEAFILKEQEAAEQAECDGYVDSDVEDIEKDEDSESELEDEDEDPTVKKLNITSDEKEMLRQEFTNIMYENFLSGKDEYDYKSVDENAEYDCVQVREHDEEEKYFDCD